MIRIHNTNVYKLQILVQTPEGEISRIKCHIFEIQEYGVDTKVNTNISGIGAHFGDFET